MDNKEKLEFFEEWLNEIDSNIERCDSSLINTISNKILWKLEQKCKIYNSSKELRDFFYDEVLEMDSEMENHLNDILCIRQDLDMYSLARIEIEQEMEKYK